MDANTKLKQMTPKKQITLRGLTKTEYLNAIKNKTDIEKNRSHWEKYKQLKKNCTSLFYRNKSLYFKNFIQTTSTSTKNNS